MAVVKITRDLKHHIMRAVYEPFNARFIQTTKLTPEESNIAYRKFLVSEELESHLNAIPKDYVSLSHAAGKVSLFIRDNKSFAWFELQPTISPTYRAYYWDMAPNSNTLTPEDEHRNWVKFDINQLDFLKERHAQMQTILNERAAFYAPIETMLNKCSTLNQVEKIWPAIRKYVPSEYLERLDAKSNRKTSASIGLDESELQSLNVAHIRHQMVA